MREILFRGKDENDVWQKGFYCAFNDRSYRIYSGFAETDCGDYYPDWDEVNPETVGQYTGLTDKNGKKVFEGDIIKAEFKPQNYKEPPYAIGNVVFENGTFKIAVSVSKNSSEYKTFENKDVRSFSIEHNFLDRHYVLEVIGNVFDNPELLKGDKT